MTDMFLYGISYVFTRFMSIGAPYVSCLEDMGVNMTLGYDTLKQCQSHIHQACPTTFTDQLQGQLDQCRDVLYHDGEWMTQVEPAAWEKYKGTEFYKQRPRFQNYFDCLGRFTEGAKKCASVHLDRVCRTKKVRAVKTVRAPFELAQQFLENYDNYIAVHLYRDPRGVTLSRMKADWSYAVFESSDAAILARTYCRAIMIEIEKRRALEPLYPSRIVPIIHDTVLGDMEAHTRQLFSDLYLKYTPQVSDFVEENTKLTKRDRWRTGLRLHEIRQVEEECRGLFDIAPFAYYEATENETKQRQNIYSILQLLVMSC